MLSMEKYNDGSYEDFSDAVTAVVNSDVRAGEIGREDADRLGWAVEAMEREQRMAKSAAALAKARETMPATPAELPADEVAKLEAILLSQGHGSEAPAKARIEIAVRLCRESIERGDVELARRYMAAGNLFVKPGTGWLRELRVEELVAETYWRERLDSFKGEKTIATDTVTYDTDEWKAVKQGAKDKCSDVLRLLGVDPNYRRLWTWEGEAI